MDILFLYLMAILPIVIGGILFLFKKEINWVEWVAGACLAFITAGIMHWVAISGATADTETWSGQIVDGRHYARWQEYYEYAVYRTEYYTTTEYYTDSKGHSHSHQVTHSRQVFDHWEPTSRWHDDAYNIESNINTSYDIGHDFFYYIADKFGGYHAVPGNRTTMEHHSRMIAGDPNDYVTSNRTGWVQPITNRRNFINKIKATPTTFSYAKVPTTIKIFPYPDNSNPFQSDRLIGAAMLVDIFKFDQMNARLGPSKKVNVIIVGFTKGESNMAQYQEAAWIGGKKNDIVICYGGSNKAPTWVRTFGWTDTKTCLRNLESIVLEKGISNEILPLIETEIKDHYKLKNFEKDFDYIRVPAPMWAFWTCLGVMAGTQIGFYFFAMYNGIDKGGNQESND